MQAKSGGCRRSRATARRLRPAAAARDLAAAQLLGLGVGDVQLAHALAGIVERDAHRRALALADFLAADVARRALSCEPQDSSLESGMSRTTVPETQSGITPPRAHAEFATSEAG